MILAAQGWCSHKLKHVDKEGVEGDLDCVNQEVTSFIESIAQPWQVAICTRLRDMVHQCIPDVEERIQYKKPHFLKNGKFAAVITPSNAAISFTIMNAAGLEVPEGQFEGPPERKMIRIRESQLTDYDMLSKLLVKASSTL